MTPGTSVKLVLPSLVQLVDLAHAASEKMAEAAGFDADEALNVALAVREAVINAIEHGNKGDPGLAVHLDLTLAEKGLSVSIRDQGNGFRREQTADPTLGDNLLRTSGRGLLLIDAFVDEVKYRKHAEGGMEVVLLKTKKDP